VATSFPTPAVGSSAARDGEPRDASGEAAPTAGTVRLVIRNVMSHCLACPEVPMPKDRSLGYEVLVELRVDGATTPTSQTALCDGQRVDPSRPAARACKLFDACADGDRLGQVRCGSPEAGMRSPEAGMQLAMAEVRTGPEGTVLVTGDTSRVLDARPMRVLPSARAVRLSNHD
jgi:hypothetical protein